MKERDGREAFYQDRSVTQHNSNLLQNAMSMLNHLWSLSLSLLLSCLSACPLSVSALNVTVLNCQRNYRYSEGIIETTEKYNCSELRFPALFHK